MPEWIRQINVEKIVEWGVPVIGVLVLLFFGWIVAGWVGALTRRAMARLNLDETLTKFAGKFVKWLVLLLVVLACLGLFGVDVTSFAAILAAVGFAIGMALQGTLSNFAAGVMLLVFRPFKVGDVVTVSGHTGKIDAIDLFVTTMDTPDNRRLILPNSQVFGATIENISFHDTRRVDVVVGTDYTADIDAARKVLFEAAKGIDNVLGDPEPAVVLTGLGGSSIDWSVRVWCRSEDFWAVKDDLTREVKYRLDGAGIGIPFPQMDVHVTQQ